MSAREVTLLGGSPWGFRMHGGHDLHQPLRISRVNPGSKAAQQGVREGDLISSINGRNTRELTNSEAHALLRNAGEHLKLGLNQENVGSPKRRIYKSSLQENTSTEIHNKTITKTTTTTSNSRIISAEAKKNETNEIKPDNQGKKRNGALRSLEEERKSEAKGGFFDAPGYSTDTEDFRMPHNSRTRRNRKHRDRRRFERLRQIPQSPKTEETIEETITETEDPHNEPEIIFPSSTSSTSTDETERKIHLSSKRKIGRKIHPPQPSNVIEIRTIGSLPLKAAIEHIPGVGILESGSAIEAVDDVSVITVYEPLEPLKPFDSTSLSNGRLTSFDRSRNGLDRLEIREISDASDVETENVPAIIVEIESDVEKETCQRNNNKNGNNNNSDSEIEETELSRGIRTMPKEVERKLRNFVEGLRLPAGEGESTEKLTNSQKRRSKRAILESYYCQSQAANRFLDIIQEEGEKLSEDDEQHVRDFINEEIGKFRREERPRRLDIEEEEEEEEEAVKSAKFQWEEEKREGMEEIGEKAGPEFVAECVELEVKRVAPVDIGERIENIANIEKVGKIENLGEEGEEGVVVDRVNGGLGGEMEEEEVKEKLSEEGKNVGKREERFDVVDEVIVEEEEEEEEELKKEVELKEDLKQQSKENLTEELKEQSQEELNDKLPEDSKGKLQENQRKETDKTSTENSDTKPKEESEEKLNPKESVSETLNKPMEETKKNSEDAKPSTETPEETLKQESNENPQEKSKTESHVLNQAKETSENQLQKKSLESNKSTSVLKTEESVVEEYSSEQRTVKIINKTPQVKEQLDKSPQKSSDSNNSIPNLSNKKPAPPPPKRSSSLDKSSSAEENLSTDSIENSSVPPVPPLRRKKTTEETPTAEEPPKRPPPPKESKSPIESPKRPSSPQKDEAESRKDTPANVPEISVKLGDNANPEIARDRITRTPERQKFDSPMTSRDTESSESAKRGEECRKNSSVQKEEISRRKSTEEKSKNLRKEIVSESSESIIEKHETTQTFHSTKKYEPKVEFDRSVKSKSINVTNEKSSENSSENREGKNEPISTADFTKKFKETRDLPKNPKSKEKHEDKSSKTEHLIEVRLTDKNAKPAQTDDHPGEHLYYVPLHDDSAREATNSSRDFSKIARTNELTAGKSNLDASHPPRDKTSTASPEKLTSSQTRVSENRTLNQTLNTKKMEESWSGLRTTKDPKILVCLSPSQRKSTLRTTADNLLDLHEKFLNRYTYSEEEPHKVPLPKYRVEVETPTKSESKTSDKKQPNVSAKSSNRLLEIIREYSKKSDDGNVSEFFRKESTECEKERHEITRLSDWMNLARSEATSSNVSRSDESSSKKRHKERAEEKPTIEKSCDKSGSSVGRKLNTALIDRSPERVDRRGASSGWKSANDLKRINVNPALIDDKVEVPPRAKRSVTVDRSCIDTTSIFDRAPPRSHLEPRKYRSAEDLKRSAASEIMDSLKRLRFDTEDRMDGVEKRHSRPQEYYGQRLKYIELLEDQLKNVLLAEEEEKTAFDEYESAKEDFFSEPEFDRIFEERKERHSDGKDEEFEEQKWQEKRRNVEKDRSESFDEEGRRGFSRKIHDENGIHEEESRETIEHKESRFVVTRKDNSSKEAENEEKNSVSPLLFSKTDSNKMKAVPTNGEAFRRQMYDEYVDKVMEREERKQQRVVKISSTVEQHKKTESNNMSAMEKEFIEKAKNRLNKFGIKLDESESETDVERNGNKKVKEEETARCLVDGKELEDSEKLPEHLREFLKISGGVWSPGSEPPPPPKQPSPEKETQRDAGIPPVWTPSSAGASPVPERKEFRPVQFESPVLSRKQYPEQSSAEKTTPPWQAEEAEEISKKEIVSSRIINSQSANSQSFGSLTSTARLPRAQNPTITLLQKAREGQLPKGAAYLEESEENKRLREEEKPLIGPGEIRTRYGYGSGSGYLSEPEPPAYSDRAATFDARRRTRNKENDFTLVSSTMPRKNGPLKYSTDIYKNQPGRIEDYEPGRSSIAEKEAKEWWDEVMDIFDGPFDDRQRNARATKPYMSQALKESGYESDSTLVFRRREDISPLSLLEQRLAYKNVQSGGDVPLHGLRKPAPERPKESPRRYVEGEVTIHYRSPVRTEAKEPLSEEELARRSAENMRRVYQEERRRKYLQELHDIDSRRHTDNFTPLQKSPIPLNRYDDFVDDSSLRSRSQEQTPEPRLVARALYNFVGQSSRELTFRRGDIIFVRRQVDKNWYEGEHNAMVGLFPFNYVEILPFDGVRTTPKKPYEGQARAKFNFVAQTNLELPLAKGELVVLTRRVDENWYEGRSGNRKGIFPVSYVEVITEPGLRSDSPTQGKPVASPAAHSLLANGSAGGKMSMGAHHYMPSIPVNINATQPHYNSLPRMGGSGSKLPTTQLNEALHIDTHSEPIPYRALYNYKPQNEDELELKEGDVVYVMEKCDDGWYVGSSQRTGYFGTFPGNYVERL